MTHEDIHAEYMDQLDGELSVHNMSLKKLGLEPMTLEEYLEHR